MTDQAQKKAGRKQERMPNRNRNRNRNRRRSRKEAARLARSSQNASKRAAEGIPANAGRGNQEGRGGGGRKKRFAEAKARHIDIVRRRVALWCRSGLGAWLVFWRAGRRAAVL